MIIFSSGCFKKNKFHHQRVNPIGFIFNMAPTIRVNSPPHMGFLFFSWFHRGWRVLLQLPAVGLGELDVTPLVGNGTELSELFDLSLGCETFMKTHWFRWCERKGVRFTELFGYEKHPGTRTGSDFGAINRWMSMFITEKGLILMKIGFTAPQMKFRDVEKWALQPSN